MFAGWQVSDQRDFVSWKLSSNCPVLPHVLLCVVSRWGRAPGVWWEKMEWFESLLGPSDLLDHLDMDVDIPFIQLCLLFIGTQLSPCLDKSCSFKPGPIMEKNIIHLSDSLQTWKTNPTLHSLVFQSFRRLSVNPARGFSRVYAVGWGC